MNSFEQTRFENIRSLFAAERRDHRTTRKYLTAYRWIACTGWGLLIIVLLMEPAHAGLGKTVAVFAGGWILLSIVTAYGLCKLIRRAKNQ